MLKPFLQAFFPNAKATVIDAMVETFPAAKKRYGITRNSLALALGQVKVESGGLTRFDENMSYSAQRIMVIYGVGHNSAAVTASEANRLARNPKGLAMRVYGTGKKAVTLGNRNPEDGWNYRGGGPIQLTGYGMYLEVQEKTSVNFAKSPELARDPHYAWDVIYGFFAVKKLLSYLNSVVTDSVITKVTERTNGGHTELAARKTNTYQALRLIDKYDALKVADSVAAAPSIASAVVKSPAPAPVIADVNPTMAVMTDAIVDVAQPSPVPTPEPVIADVNPTSSAVVTDSDVLARYGDKNEYVRLFQEKAKTLNYWTGAMDGDFGPFTRDVLFSYQANNGFTVEPVLRREHMARMDTKDAVPRQISLDRQTADVNFPALKESVTIRAARRIKAAAVGLLTVLGIAVPADPSSVGLIGTYVQNRDKVKEVVQPVLDAIGYPYTLYAVGVAVAIFFIYWSGVVVSERVASYRDGSNLKR